MPSPGNEASEAPQSPGDALKAGAKDLLESGLYSDLMIVSGMSSFAVHKFVLHTQSKYFRTLLSGGFKESVNAITELPLPESAEVLDVMIKHLYSFDYDDTNRGNISASRFSIYVFACADKYEIDTLAALAAKRFKETLTTNNMDASVANVRAVEEHTSSLNSPLWDTIISVTKENVTTLLPNVKFQQLLKDLDQFNIRLISELAQKETKPRSTRFPPPPRQGIVTLPSSARHMPPADHTVRHPAGGLRYIDS